MCAMAGAHPAWDCSPMGPNTLEHQVAWARRQAATPKMELEPYETKNIKKRLILDIQVTPSNTK